MTVNELYKQGAEFLENAEKENAGFDARCLMEHVLNVNTTKFMLIRDRKIDAKTEMQYLSLIRRRVSGEPLQYILGQWEFMDCRFSVGEGVLIPRPETEILVNYGLNFIKNKKSPVVFDLCSGTGCVGISVAKARKDAVVYAVEKSDEAFAYLEKNIKLNSVKNVKAVKGDICDFMLLNGITPDLILSNPPYVPSDEIDYLQAEVKKEPRMALDGGKDGYDFYKILAKDWLNRLPKGGSMAVECAENQADDISQMFFLAKSQVDIINDLSGFPRVVTAVK